jgi:hypothetical protein
MTRFDNVSLVHIHRLHSIGLISNETMIILCTLDRKKTKKNEYEGLSR